jgi:FtsZ-interacting cell division protein ZipA
MSDLQLGLLILGLLLVAGVMSYNWWQSRRWHQQTGAAARKAAHAAAADPVVENTPRIEPHFDGGDSEPLSDETEADDLLPPEQLLDCVIEVRASEVMAPLDLKALRSVLANCVKPVQVLGFNYHAREWEPLATDPGAEYTMVRVALQLVDRAGAVTLSQLEEFASHVREFAAGNHAIVQQLDLAGEIARAESLDQFCAEVDEVVGVSVIAPTGQFFHGSKIRSLADGMGLQLQPAGIFQCRGDDGGVLFSLENQEPKAFAPERLRSMTTSGLTFLLDVPRTADGIRAFERMLTVARSYAESLDGILADDNRVTLTEAGLEKIRAHLRGIYASMNARGISAGGAVAMRLFS